MIALYRTLAARSLLGKKGRSLMTVLGIGLGVTMVVAVALTNGAIMASYQSMLEGVAGRADLQVTASAGQGFPIELLDEVRAVAGVRAAVPAVSSGSPVLFGQKQTVATIYGIDPGQDTLIRDYHLTAGQLPAGDDELAVSAELAGGLGLQLGDRVKLLATTGYSELQVVGVFETGGTVRGSLGPFGAIRLGRAQQLFGKAGKLDTIDLLVAPGARPESVEQAIGQRLNGRARVGTPLERSRDMQKLLDSIVFTLTFASAVSLFAGAFIVYTNVAMGVAERRRDLSILRALGLRRREALWLVLSEAATMGLAGAGLGLLWGYGLASTMAQQMTGRFLVVYGIQASQVVLGLGDVVVALVIGLGVSVLAAYGPAREAVAISPVEAMRPDDVQVNGQETHGLARALAGLALIAAPAATIFATWPREGMLPLPLLRLWGALAAAVLLGVVVLLPVALPAANRRLLRPLQVALFGVTGRLASDNLVRQPRRAAATAAALMVSLMFMVGIGGMGVSQQATFDRWYQKAVGWDLNVSTSFVGIGAQVEMDPALVRTLEAVPGVRLASPQKMGRIVLGDGEPAFLQVFDHRLLRQYSEMPLEAGSWPAAVDALERGGASLISPAIARRLGLGLGDTLKLPSPSGEQAFRIVGILQDVSGFGGTIELDRQDYVRAWNDETSTNVALLVADPARVEAVRQAILDRLGSSTNLLVRSNREFWQELRGYYESFYQLMDGLVAIAILVSGLAIANTLFASVLERRREIGILRAVGTKRGEVVRVVLGEALCTGLVGGSLGIALGLGLEALFVASTEFISGAAMELVAPWRLLGMAVGVALLLAPLVGLLPARWAARLDVVDALRYE
ncbi:MAG: ABC transporter permease [Chloroflexi bacterium]|nr:ABC transporter permease [Chloroflexota bacterium]